MKLMKINEFVIEETGVKVIIIGDVETKGAAYAEAHLKWPKELSLKENEKH